MARSGYILAIDQGTTGTTAIAVDGSGKVVWQTTTEIRQMFPQAGWVEHSPEELFGSSMEVIDEVLEETEISPRQIRAIGITNQRETTLVWERSTGRPVTNAVVWQCRRTAPLCEALKAQGLEETVRAKTGLPIDAYFSSTKIRWILDNIPNGQRRAEAGELAFGTVDSWLIWNLTNGTTHVTDVTNASRTMLYNINSMDWDAELLDDLDIPMAMMPQVVSSSGICGYASGSLFRGQSIPIAGLAGDQHAALFGQACFNRGMVKNTYGTGSFVLMNTGDSLVPSKHGLVTTIAWKLGDEVSYALEGSIFSTGATLQWLRDGLELFDSLSDVEELAALVADNGGVYLVPAFTGLGAPHWDMYARGAIVGITRGTSKSHLARAALEATAYQTKDVIDAMYADTGIHISKLRVDGGGSQNSFLMQFQSDLLGVEIKCSAVRETTALGAAYLAGLAVGFWESTEEIQEMWASDKTYAPDMSNELRDGLYDDWKQAVERAKGWANRE